MQMREIKLTELEDAFKIVQELKIGLDYNEYEDIVYEMRHQDYKMYGVYEKEKLVCYCGFSILTNLYYKRHLYVYELITPQKSRGLGYASEMLRYINDLANINNCDNIVLNSSLKRDNALRYYENRGFEEVSKIFLKTLNI